MYGQPTRSFVDVYANLVNASILSIDLEEFS